MKVAITNTGKNTMYVGTASIPPGETRHVDPAYLPVHMRPKQPKPMAAMPGDPLDELLAGGVKSIIAAIPGLTINDLERLGELEQKKGDGARKTLLSAIGEALLERASTDNPMEKLSDEELSAMREEETAKGQAADAGLIEQINAEISLRAARTLAGFSDEALADALNELEAAGAAADPADIAAVKAEINRRTQGQ
jgi:hypothetical protein